jgi:hypothetical protein
MSKVYDDLLAELKGDMCIGVVLGNMGWGDYGSEIVPNYKDMPKGKLITLEQAKPFLDYEYDTGYGAPELPAIYAWTQDRVIAVSQYDGATGFFSIPRNPIDCLPTMEGG